MLHMSERIAIDRQSAIVANLLKRDVYIQFAIELTNETLLNPWQLRIQFPLDVPS